jgi:hypothetical protein
MKRILLYLGLFIAGLVICNVLIAIGWVQTSYVFAGAYGFILGSNIRTEVDKHKQEKK